MNLIIHRGTHEIGGSCVELESGKTRIIIDLGIPLVDDKKEKFDTKILEGKTVNQLKELGMLPPVKGLYKAEDRSIDAIFISHCHLDHYGLLKYVHPEIPVYMSEGAHVLMGISDIFTPNKIGSVNAHVIPKHEKTQIGDFSITPYLVDHSAFDALAFLIEADGKRLFYSGDFRGHGRKSDLFKQMIKDPPKDIDCLVMEGTSLGSEEQIYKDEVAVEKAIEDLLRNKSNITFFFTSSQNIDRLVSAYKACRRTDSLFVLDIYTAFVLLKIGEISPKIPQFNWSNMWVLFFETYEKKLVESGNGDVLALFEKRKINFDRINAERSRVFMIMRDNFLFPEVLRQIGDTNGATAVYSMWEGYLTDSFKNVCTEKGIEIKKIHTSGHAIIGDLQAFDEALKPRVLIPIHTFEAKKFPELFKNVKILEDGEVFIV